MKLLYCLSSLTLRRFRSTIVVESLLIFFIRVMRNRFVDALKGKSIQFRKIHTFSFPLENLLILSQIIVFIKKKKFVD